MADQRARMDIAQLVAEHHRAVYRYSYRLTGSVHDAEDLTQQVFLVAQQKLGQLRNPPSARSWLFAILRNCFLKGQQRQRPVSMATLKTTIDSAVQEVSLDEEIDPEGLQQALNELPAKLRLVLVMFYFDDCSYREIAQQLALPIGTVMSRLARAKRHLRSKLFLPDYPVPSPQRVPPARVTP
jgi:RNA polymerase sigma-70 factor, ECF subfamily